jgi:hypothetical protein
MCVQLTTPAAVTKLKGELLCFITIPELGHYVSYRLHGGVGRHSLAVNQLVALQQAGRTIPAWLHFQSVERYGRLFIA